MRNRHRLTRFTPSNSTVSSTNVDLENGSRCQKVPTGDNVLLWGCQKSVMEASLGYPRGMIRLGRLEDVPFKGRREKFKRIGGTLGAARDVLLRLLRVPWWDREPTLLEPLRTHAV